MSSSRPSAGPGDAGGHRLWGEQRIRHLTVVLRLIQISPLILGLYALVAAVFALRLAGDLVTRIDTLVFFRALAIPVLGMWYLATVALRALPDSDLRARRWAVFTGVLVCITAFFVATHPVGIAGVGLGAAAVVLAVMPDDRRHET